MKINEILIKENLNIKFKDNNGDVWEVSKIPSHDNLTLILTTGGSRVVITNMMYLDDIFNLDFEIIGEKDISTQNINDFSTTEEFYKKMRSTPIKMEICVQNFEDINYDSIEKKPSIKYPLEDMNFSKKKKERIDMLNEKFFNDINLIQDEEKILIWLCGWDDFTIKNVISAFEKIKK